MVSKGESGGEGYIRSMELTDTHFFFFLSFVFLRPHPQHTEVPRLGVKLEL